MRRIFWRQQRDSAPSAIRQHWLIRLRFTERCRRWRCSMSMPMPPLDADAAAILMVTERTQRPAQVETMRRTSELETASRKPRCASDPRASTLSPSWRKPNASQTRDRMPTRSEASGTDRHSQTRRRTVRYGPRHAWGTLAGERGAEFEKVVPRRGLEPPQCCHR
jgi:hypothetical protein